jgi:hypothetical protein
LFKVEIKGGEVFTLTSAQKVERYFDRMEGAKQKFNPTAYKIVKDTDKSLIAAYAYPNETTIDVVLVDKTSRSFHQTVIYVKESGKSENTEFTERGICQTGK